MTPYRPPEPTPDNFRCLVKTRSAGWTEVRREVVPDHRLGGVWRSLATGFTLDAARILDFAPLPPTQHVWVPVSECGELADGRWRCVVTNVLPAYEDLPPRECWVKREGGKWGLMYGLAVTRVLSPHLGPIPEAHHG